MKNILISLFFLLSLPITGLSIAGQYEHVLGETYDITERHPTEEIKEASNKVDWVKTYSKIKELKLPVTRIERATRNREFTHKVLSVTDVDVANPNTGEMLYPKGYTFNPLEYIRLPKFIIISDHKKDIEWLKKQQVDISTMILTVSDPFKLGKEINRKVMILKDDLKEKLKIEFYPAIVQQIGIKIQVNEYLVPL